MPTKEISCGCVGSEPGQPCPKCAIDEAGMAAPAKTVDLTPTPGALKHLHTVFQAEAKQARKNAEAASNLADELEEANNNSDDYAGRPSLQRVVHVMDDRDITLVIQALHGFADAEHQRAEKLDAGAVECGGTLAERILARNESEFDCGCGNCTCCGLVKEAVAAGMRRDETPHQFVRRS